jgi:hypothetical protein
MVSQDQEYFIHLWVQTNTIGCFKYQDDFLANLYSTMLMHDVDIFCAENYYKTVLHLLL